jgi:hypothetical protein
MVLLLACLCAGYIGVVIVVRRGIRAGKLAAAAAAAVPLPALPADDLPPAGAVGWPPEGAGFPTYVEEGFAALDAYLSGGFAP